MLPVLHRNVVPRQTQTEIPQYDSWSKSFLARTRSYLADVLARVGEGDLVDLVGVEPDLPLSAFEYGGGKPLLKLQRNLHTKGGGREGGKKKVSGTIFRKESQKVRTGPYGAGFPDASVDLSVLPYRPRGAISKSGHNVRTLRALEST